MRHSRRLLRMLLVPTGLGAVACGSFGEAQTVPDGGPARAADSALPPGADPSDAAAFDALGCAATIADESDFGAVPTGWQVTPVVAHDPDVSFKSKNGSLRTETTGGATAAHIEKLHPTVPVSRVRLAYAMHVAPMTAGKADVGCHLVVETDQSPTSSYSFGPDFADNALAFDDDVNISGRGQGSTPDVPDVPDVAIGNVASGPRWFAMVVELDKLGPSSGHLTAWVDAAKLVDQDVPLPAAPRAFRIRCGLARVEGAPSMTMHIDDFSFVACP